MVRVLDLQSRGQFHIHVVTLGQHVLTHHIYASVTKQYNLVLAKKQLGS